MFKNVAGQSLLLYAFDTTVEVPKTGDGNNITAYVSLNGATSAALTDTTAGQVSATLAPGWYKWDLTQAETNADQLLFTAASVTANIKLRALLVQTRPPNFTAQSIDSNGRVDVIKVAGTTQTAGDHTALLNTIDDFLDTEVAAILAAVDTEVAAIKNKTDNLPNDPADASDIASSFTTVNTKLDTIDDFLDTEVSAIKNKTDNLPNDPADASDISALIDALPTGSEAATALLDAANAIETGLTVRGALRLIAAATAGKLSGASTGTNTFRNAVQDSKNRIVATVDGDGNRSAITTDVT